MTTRGSLCLIERVVAAIWLNRVLLLRIAACSLAAAITFLSLVPPALRPETGVPRGLEHFAIYFVTGLTFYMGFKWRLYLLAATFISFAALVETMQMLVPGRHARISDFIVDATALCLPLLILPALKQLQAIASEP